MLTEAILGPLWAWIIIKEQPSVLIFTGGVIVLFAVLLQLLSLMKYGNRNIK